MWTLQACVTASELSRAHTFSLTSCLNITVFSFQRVFLELESQLPDKTLPKYSPEFVRNRCRMWFNTLKWVQQQLKPSVSRFNVLNVSCFTSKLSAEVRNMKPQQGGLITTLTTCDLLGSRNSLKKLRLVKEQDTFMSHHLLFMWRRPCSGALNTSRTTEV